MMSPKGECRLGVGCCRRRLIADRRGADRGMFFPSMPSLLGRGNPRPAAPDTSAPQYYLTRCVKSNRLDQAAPGCTISVDNYPRWRRSGLAAFRRFDLGERRSRRAFGASALARRAGFAGFARQGMTWPSFAQHSCALVESLSGSRPVPTVGLACCLTVGLTASRLSV